MRDVEPRENVQQQETLAAERLPVDQPVEVVDTERSEPAPPATTAVHTGAADAGATLFADDAIGRLRGRWRELQADFVDDPQRAVRGADQLVDEVMRTIAEHKHRLEGDWQGSTDTEELRIALRGYRSVFDQLLPT